MKYRSKRPAVVTAERFWSRLRPWPTGVCDCDKHPRHGPHLHLSEGGATQVFEGDWVIAEERGLLRFFSRIDHDTFTAEYEVLEA